MWVVAVIHRGHEQARQARVALVVHVTAACMLYNDVDALPLQRAHLRRMRANVVQDASFRGLL
jgi:hypothetical protein